MTDTGGRRRRSIWIVAALALLVLSGTVGLIALAKFRSLSRIVDDKFAGRRWDFPSRIYSGEALLFVGLDLQAGGVTRRLERLAYRPTAGEPQVGGEFRRSDDALEIALRPGARGRERTQRVRLSLRDGKVGAIADLDSGESLAAVALEPEEITGIYEGEWKQRRAIKVVDVAPILVRAILATEDTRFFEHHGLDVIGIGRAALTNLRSGRVRQGGSTLTQQLMKNFFLTTDRTFSRKLTEMAMSLVAEQRYSKMQILENYLNEIYLGQRGARGIFGVAEAARFYFGKDPRDLSLPEVALIAGLIRAPNAYSPYHSPERARERRNTVLRLLLDGGDIDEAAYRAAVASPLGVVTAPTDLNDASYFVDLVKGELAGRFPPEVLTTEGLKIYTSLDPLLQEQANRAVASGLERLEKDHPRLARTKGQDRLEGALLAVAPHTGAIKALVGGRSYVESQFNRATQARRQPGSAFKPIVFLAGLLAEGPQHLTATTILDDEPFTWVFDGGREWSPDNDGGHYFGPVTAQTALERSLNAATAHVAQSVGLPAIVELARSLGWTSPLPQVPSIALGSAEVSLAELTSIYAVFASGGTRAEPIAIERVESRDGEVIVGQQPTMSAAIPPEAAYVLTRMLEGVLERGTAHGARASAFTRPAAGKTGTTNDFRDAWFVGYTPDLIAGVWVGFDQRAPLSLTGARAALPIWTDFMKQATAAQPPRDFPRPPGVTLVAVDLETGERVADPGDSAASGGSAWEAFFDADVPAEAASPPTPRPVAPEPPAGEEPGAEDRVALDRAAAPRPR